MPGTTYPKRWFEDFAEGEELEYGETLVTRDDIVEFGRKYDPEPYHTDEEAAKETLFGTLVASGVQVAGWWRRMNLEAFPDLFSEGSPGWDEIRWTAPVVPGEVLSVRSRVEATRPLRSRPHLGLVQFRSEVFDRGSGAVKMTLRSTIFYRRRPAEAA